MNRINKMRTKNFLIVLCCIIMTSMVLILIGPSGTVPANDSTLRTIFSQTNQQLQHLKVSERGFKVEIEGMFFYYGPSNQTLNHLSSFLPSFQDAVAVEPKNQLVVDDKFLTLLGYPPEGVISSTSSSSSSTNSNPPTSAESLSSNSVNAESPNPVSGSVVNLESGGGGAKAEDALRSSRSNAPKSDYAVTSLLWPTGNAEKLTNFNFSLVSYVLANQLASAVQLVKNLNAAVPGEHLLLYDLGLSEDDQRVMQKYCYPIMNSTAAVPSPAVSAGPNQPHSQQQSVAAASSPAVARALNFYNEAGAVNGANSYNAYSVIQSSGSSSSSSSSNLNLNNLNLNNNFSQVGSTPSFKCLLIKFDLVASGFPSYVIDDAQMHAFRPLIVRHALQRLSSSVLFLENSVRLRANSAGELAELRRLVEASASGVKGWRTEPTLAVSARTHQKMYEYFHTDDDNFKFLKMLSLDALLFVDRPAVNQRILLPWIKCALIPECIHPIGEFIIENKLFFPE